jgi:hypothetical protein
LLSPVIFIIGDRVIFGDEFSHPFQDLRIGLIDALGPHIEFKEAMHRRFARDEIKPVIPLSFFPPIEGAHTSS